MATRKKSVTAKNQSERGGVFEAMDQRKAKTVKYGTLTRKQFFTVAKKVGEVQEKEFGIADFNFVRDLDNAGKLIGVATAMVVRLGGYIPFGSEGDNFGAAIGEMLDQLENLSEFLNNK